ncbi:MAG: hypothetical protein RLZZ435_582 [Cyanobacteriota bacterium]|jgi:hypothetical protein
MAIAVAGVLEPKSKREVRRSDRVSMGGSAKRSGYFSMNPIAVQGGYIQTPIQLD